MYDVAIVGGGPAGSTAGTLLKKYSPSLSVAIFEREKFPRDHVGESQLPPIGAILNEMGCWDKVEAANFPIKIGATYLWGKSPELWDFEFIPGASFAGAVRPAPYEGDRKLTALQVDRAIYDKILLDHAAEVGCELFEETRVRSVRCQGDSAECFVLDSGAEIRARYYLDASGHPGVLRRAMGVQTDKATSLQNIAIWDYWQNTDWAVKLGIDGTRIQIISVNYGWIWFIPLGPTRTSVGLVVPAAYYKRSGLRPHELYRQALKDSPMIANLMINAASENKIQTTNDWSFLAKRMVGENWFLIGESAGFADPILSAGLTLTQSAAREAAYTILELDRGKHDPCWLKQEFERRQCAAIKSHIRFADFWYTANAQFRDLKEFTSEIAKEAGLELSPDNAWKWLAQGGFIGVDLGLGIAGFDLASVKDLDEYMTPLSAGSPLESNNLFTLNLAGANWKEGAFYSDGTISKLPRYERDGRVLPLAGVYELWVNVLQRANRLADIRSSLDRVVTQRANDRAFQENVLWFLTAALEAMITDGWVLAEYDPTQPTAPLVGGASQVHWNADQRL